ncbi:hypothetical protein [Tenacibaculum sp. 190130A14a]|uniref:hypothetical protein n=2 Tax=Tenacibaculum polynesiense TaxID=3137857 RepID=UPI0032B1A15E
MKKLLLVFAMVAAGFTANAQESNGQTEKGKWLIETNTGFGAGHAANTGFYLASSDGNTTWAVGAEGGYFVMDDLAIKAGLGYNDSFEAFTYKVGAKYYIESMIPVQLDLTGSARDGSNPMWLGIQGGYAIFLGENVSIEPGLRYNLGIGDAEDANLFQFNVGFALHF